MMEVLVEVLVKVTVEVEERTRVKNSFPSSLASLSFVEGGSRSAEGSSSARSVKSSML